MRRLSPILTTQIIIEVKIKNRRIIILERCENTKKPKGVKDDDDR